MRSIKLQLDYLKPQVLLNQHVVDPKEAQQRINLLNKQIEHKPQNKRLINKLAIANHIQIKNQYYQVAPEFAGIVGKSGNGPNDSQLVVITGGGYCIIKAANCGAAEAQAETVGLNITLPNEQFSDPYVIPELCF